MWRTVWMLGAGGCGGLAPLNIDPPTPSDVPVDTDLPTPDTPDTPEPNDPPEADAGDPELGREGDVIPLRGSGFDPDGDPLTFEWFMDEHPSAWSSVIVDADQPTASFLANAAGDYQARVDVSDGEHTTSATVLFIIQPANQPPVANAGADLVTPRDVAVFLDGTSSFDPEFDAIDYDWRISVAPPGSSVSLQNPTIARPSLRPDVPGIFTVELTVTDAIGNNSAPDLVRVVSE